MEKAPDVDYEAILRKRKINYIQKQKKKAKKLEKQEYAQNLVDMTTEPKMVIATAMVMADKHYGSDSDIASATEEEIAELDI